MTIELKPCPFCGSTDIQIVPMEDDADCPQTYGYSVACMNCDCTGAGMLQSGKKEVGAQWNLRPGENVLTTQIAALTAERDAARKALADIAKWQHCERQAISQAAQKILDEIYEKQAARKE